MKLKLALPMMALGAAGAVATVHAAESSISGAGATFPYPLYSKWADTYAKESQIKLNYQAIGSGGGIKQITEGTVDFGASDAPLKPEELDKANLVQFPVVMGGVVPVINLKGVQSDDIKLTPELLVDLFLGKIKKWNDAKIAAANTGAKLPDAAVTVVHRSDGSGTTWIFTNYLAKVSPEWSKSVGNDKSVSWPTGVGGKGNQGVASYVQRIPGAIGYVETAYAVQNKMTQVKLKNDAGSFVAADDAAVQAAAKGADWRGAKSFYMVLTNQPGAGAWPITGATFVLMQRKQKRPEVAREVLKFFDWGYRNGGAAAKELGYVPMPKDVIDMVQKSWQTELSDQSGGKLWPAERQHASNK
jgi:phosphate transport system substrate-binding protein